MRRHLKPPATASTAPGCGPTGLESNVMDGIAPEEWRPIPGFERTYEISSLGRVRSIPRPGTRGGILKLPLDSDGYPRMTLAQDGTATPMSVHRMVARVFIGPRPDGLEVRHLDGVANHCWVGNLTYGTGSQNILDAVRHGTHPEARKTHCPRGHEYNEENTYRMPSRPSYRYCRTCNRDRRPQAA